MVYASATAEEFEELEGTPSAEVMDGPLEPEPEPEPPRAPPPSTQAAPGTDPLTAGQLKLEQFFTAMRVDDPSLRPSSATWSNSTTSHPHSSSSHAQYPPSTLAPPPVPPMSPLHSSSSAQSLHDQPPTARSIQQGPPSYSSSPYQFQSNYSAGPPPPTVLVTPSNANLTTNFNYNLTVMDSGVQQNYPSSSTSNDSRHVHPTPVSLLKPSSFEPSAPPIPSAPPMPSNPHSHSGAPSSSGGAGGRELLTALFPGQRLTAQHSPGDGQASVDGSPQDLPPQQQQPLGAPLLQPFPPPNPPQSLAVGVQLTRESVRAALHRLVQSDQFLDMVYEEMRAAAGLPHSSGN
eukprot:TRINITY_DN7339_c0_g1_i2.p1 TRINITY_DN7339_c0_g1~~TRINITY_DN7339_c0_g1_i2.p1  ORF type:complete len:347 (-),score=68.16 TRINITY_DN7339_c0_g1_i2:754-1794(-)